MNRRVLLIGGTAYAPALTAVEAKRKTLVATVPDMVSARDIISTETFDFIVADLDTPGVEVDSVIRLAAAAPLCAGVLIFGDMNTARARAARDLATALSVNLVGILVSPIRASDIARLLEGVSLTEEPERAGSAAILSEAEFLRGLMTDGLVAAYQPKVDLKTGRIVGAEAFARWRGPSGGILGAGAVLRLARQRGYMDVLAHRMLELVVAELGLWVQMGMELKVSVNVSTENLRRSDFVDVVTNLAAVHKVPPHLIQLEITESEINWDDSPLKDSMQRLNGRGFPLALDDFGTGLASLMKLSEVKFEEIVVDRRFTRTAVDEGPARTVLEGAIGVIHKLGLVCTCEGIEDAATRDLVAGLGADVGQGFLLGQPMVGTEFLELLDRQ
ncbi:EAL domain-containing protein [Pseudokordiimonas caeni]|uniref:EAL domain-containing protein n=1 Tax=Pseudokordiimonas caeni TaxID=2997908 RepID=UPI002810FBFE|nr:EAL domain-containing protein [Pseudokordiimonas caeni]